MLTTKKCILYCYKVGMKPVIHELIKQHKPIGFLTFVKKEWKYNEDMYNWCRQPIYAGNP